MKGRKPRLRVVDANTVAPPPIQRAPAWLSKEARAEWDRVAPALHRRGLLAPDTLATVASYCTAAGQVAELEQIMGAEGRIVTGDDGARPHPAHRMQLAALREARLLAGELGLTPHRRGKTAEDAPADPWGGMLA